MAAPCKVPAFFVPGAPPPPVPLLTAHTEMFNEILHPQILAREELFPTSNRKYRASMPKTRRKISKCASPSGDEDSSNSGSLSSSSMDTDSSDDDVATSGLIPKPSGEQGRPGRGGYQLDVALGWKSDDFKKLKNRLHSLITTHLDTSSTVSLQNDEDMNVVLEKAVESFPCLSNYENCWPATDIIAARLHYTTTRHRKKVREIGIDIRESDKKALKKAKKTKGGKK